MRRPAEEKNHDKLSQVDYFNKGDFSKRKETNIFVSADEISEPSETLKKLRPPAEEKNRDKLSRSQESAQLNFKANDRINDVRSQSGSHKVNHAQQPYRNHQSFGHYIRYKSNVAKSIAYHAGKLANEQDYHVQQLMREFEYEQSIHLNR